MRAGGEPFSLPARAHEARARLERVAMRTTDKSKKAQEAEPVGIVISGGPVRETPPLISAYVWGAAPKEPRVTDARAARRVIG
jgi:hypothetical protein